MRTTLSHRYNSPNADLTTRFLERTSWNFCTLELFPDEGETCWYADDNKFTNFEGTMERWTLAVPGMNWYVRLYAPDGGVARGL